MLGSTRKSDENMYFEILRSASTGMFWWRIVAANGQVLAHSEQYTAKQSCVNAIGTVKRGAAMARVYDRT
jgi:uncharacterized protein YegP (UPF0339 family)